MNRRQIIFQLLAISSAAGMSSRLLRGDQGVERKAREIHDRYIQTTEKKFDQWIAEGFITLEDKPAKMRSIQADALWPDIDYSGVGEWPDCDWSKAHVTGYSSAWRRHIPQARMELGIA